jgi:hypothetical protein
MSERRPVLVDGERVPNLWVRETKAGERRFDVQTRVDGRPTFRVLQARALEDALVEMHEVLDRSTVPAVDDVVDNAVHDELVTIVREAVRAELEAWAGPPTPFEEAIALPTAVVIEYDDLEIEETPPEPGYDVEPLDETIDQPGAPEEPAWLTPFELQRQGAPEAPRTGPAQIDRQEWIRRFVEKAAEKRQEQRG